MDSLVEAEFHGDDEKALAFCKEHDISYEIRAIQD